MIESVRRKLPGAKKKDVLGQTLTIHCLYDWESVQNALLRPHPHNIKHDTAAAFV